MYCGSRKCGTVAYIHVQYGMLQYWGAAQNLDHICFPLKSMSRINKPFWHSVGSYIYFRFNLFLTHFCPRAESRDSEPLPASADRLYGCLAWIWKSAVDPCEGVESSAPRCCTGLHGFKGGATPGGKCIEAVGRYQSRVTKQFGILLAGDRWSSEGSHCSLLL